MLNFRIESQSQTLIDNRNKDLFMSESIYESLNEVCGIKLLRLVIVSLSLKLIVKTILRSLCVVDHPGQGKLYMSASYVYVYFQR